MLEKFVIDVGPELLDDLHARLAHARLPIDRERHGWQDGIDVGWLDDVLTHWRQRFDWKVHQDALNLFGQVRGDVKGTMLHAIHARGNGPAPFPLLLAHGWPDSVLRFKHLIPLLTEPEVHGADPKDAFHVVAPSLPGFGFSDRGGTYGNALGFGALFGHLMEELGYRLYGAHGGDLGSGACERLALARPDEVIGIHLTDVPSFHASVLPNDADPDERRYFHDIQRFQQDGGGYMHIQGTRPWTPAVGLNDSPAGLAAWILEKFHAWSDRSRGFDDIYDLDDLLANVTLYWVTGTIGSSFLSYRDGARASAGDLARPAAARKPVAGFSLFPADLAMPSRGWAERFFDVKRWQKMPEGGHFAAMEQPQRLAEEIRAFFRPLREAINA